MSMHLNVEFKARCNDLDAARAVLEKHHAEFKGTDPQIDVYFNVPRGRLKLRKGTIENSLIGYAREDYAGAKESKVGLFTTEPNSELEAILTTALGVLVTVDKLRDIYFIDNVKFHLDRVVDLGTFLEVEAIDKDGTMGREKLQQQCDHYKQLLHVRDEDLLALSYSDMLLQKMQR